MHAVSGPLCRLSAPHVLLTTPLCASRDAAALACSFKAARAAYPRSKWPRKVRIGPSGAVREPASGVFDVTVAPGEDVQAAVDRCPPGGCVLLLPGTHEGPLVLQAGKEVHVFGRRLAMLQTSVDDVLSSYAEKSTCDGLFIRREASVVPDDPDNDEAEEEEEEEEENCGVWIAGGRLRLQDCDVTSASLDCLIFEGGADPTIVACT